MIVTSLEREREREREGERERVSKNINNHSPNNLPYIR